MKVCVATFYTANLLPEMIQAQRRVLDQRVPDGIEIVQEEYAQQYRDDIESANNRFLNERPDCDLVIFLDVDCVPLTDSAIPRLVDSAMAGRLVGGVQRANHIDNGQHLYVGPFCMAFTRQLWLDLGSPSFNLTPRADRAEELTFLCEEKGLPVDFLWVSHVGEPMWDLRPDIPGLPRFGLDTEYEGLFYHTFLSRCGEVYQHRFIDHCSKLIV